MERNRTPVAEANDNIGTTPPADNKRQSAWLLLLWLLPLVFLALFYLYPLLNITSISFARAQGNALVAFWETISAPRTGAVLWFTVWQAALSTFLTLLIGLPGAYLFARYSFRGKQFLRALTSIPFVLPTLVVAAAFNALLGPRGWVNLGLMAIFGLTQPPLQFSNTITAIITAHIFYNTTIVLRMVGDFWSYLDPHLGDAARVLGADRWQVLRKITLPLLSPAIAAAALLVFIFDFTSFGVILILGGPKFATLEVEIYYQTISLFDLPTAATLALLQLLCTLVLTIVYTRLSSRLSLPIEKRGHEVTQHPPRAGVEKLTVVTNVILLVALLVTPLLGLAARSFTRFGPAPRGQQVEQGLTLGNYLELNENPQGSIFFVTPAAAIRNSLIYAAATVLLAILIGLPAAWALAREQGARINRWLDPLLMLPLGTSAVTLGLGFIVALDSPPLNLRASPILVPIAHTLVAFPFVVRSLSPALRSIQPVLRKAAAILGANPFRVFLTIDLPMIGRAVLVAGVFAFTISMGEFGATALIARPEFPTIPVAIFRFLSRPGAINYGQAMALSTILMAVTTGGMLIIERFRVADIGEF
jgi:thiamine transport system permease protein